MARSRWTPRISNAICAWCGRKLPPVDGIAAGEVTHGICHECFECEIAKQEAPMAMDRKHSGWDSRIGMRRETTPVQALRDAWLFIRDLLTAFALSASVWLVLRAVVAVVRG